MGKLLVNPLFNVYKKYRQMIFANPYRFGGNLNPTAQTFVEIALITDNTQISAINQLVLDLQANNLWDKFVVIYPFVGGTAHSHKFNLKDPRDLDGAYRINWSGGVAHNSNGAKGDGVNGYGDIALRPDNIGLFPNNSHVSFYTKDKYLEANTPKRASFGSSGSSSGSMYLIVNRTGLSATSNIGADANIANYNPGVAIDGLIVGSRTSNVLNKVYTKGILRVTNTATNTYNTLHPVNVKIFAGGALPFVYSTIGSCFASMGTSLTDSEVAIFNTIITNYQTTLGRQV